MNGLVDIGNRTNGGEKCIDEMNTNNKLIMKRKLGGGFDFDFGACDF